MQWRACIFHLMVLFFVFFPFSRNFYILIFSFSVVLSYTWWKLSKGGWILAQIKIKSLRLFIFCTYEMFEVLYYFACFCKNSIFCRNWLRYSCALSCSFVITIATGVKGTKTFFHVFVCIPWIHSFQCKKIHVAFDIGLSAFGIFQPKHEIETKVREYLNLP